MEKDLDAILDGLTTPPADPVPETPPAVETPPGTPPVTGTETPPAPAGTGTETPPAVETPPAGEGAGAGTPPAKPEAESSVIRTLRTQVREAAAERDKQKSEMEILAKAYGMTAEELVAKAKADVVAKDAQSRGISPEVAKEIDEMKAKLNAQDEERQRGVFVNNITGLQKAQSLNDTQLRAFVTQAGEAGFDLLTTKIPFDRLYFALNYDTVIKSVQEQTRQAVLKDIEAQRTRTPGNTRINGGATTSKQSIDEILDGLGK